VLHDQGYAVIDEKQFTATPAVRIQPWTAENRNFRVERRPSTFQGNPPIGKATNAFTVRVVDVDGKPVEGAHVAGIAEYRISPHQFVPYDSGWTYFPNVLSDGNGMARIADPYNRCVVARHVERKLVAVRSISPQQMKGTDVLTLTMQPQCTVSGKLTAKELTARNRKLTWSNVYVCLGDGMERPMSCMSEKADYHFYLPPGTFTLIAYATDTQHVRKTITVKPGQEKLEVEPSDLPPAGLVLLEGKPAPELRGVAAWKNGGPIKLSDLRGKVVILAFSMQWSGGRYHGIMPDLFPVYGKYHDQGLVIIEVRLLGFDSNATLEERIAEIKKPFWKDRDLPISIAVAPMKPILRKSDAKAKAPCPILEDYGVNGIPTCVLIDRQGRVVGRFDPRSNRHDAGRDAVLEKVIKEKPHEPSAPAPTKETRATDAVATMLVLYR
jgi:glutathione peroxidase-family protein